MICLASRPAAASMSANVGISSRVTLPPCNQALGQRHSTHPYWLPASPFLEAEEPDLGVGAQIGADASARLPMRVRNSAPCSKDE